MINRRDILGYLASLPLLGFLNKDNISFADDKIWNSELEAIYETNGVNFIAYIAIPTVYFRNRRFDILKIAGDRLYEVSKKYISTSQEAFYKMYDLNILECLNGNYNDSILYIYHKESAEKISNGVSVEPHLIYGNSW